MLAGAAAEMRPAPAGCYAASGNRAKRAGANLVDASHSVDWSTRRAKLERSSPLAGGGRADLALRLQIPVQLLHQVRQCAGAAGRVRRVPDAHSRYQVLHPHPGQHSAHPDQFRAGDLSRHRDRRVDGPLEDHPQHGHPLHRNPAADPGGGLDSARDPDVADRRILDRLHHLPRRAVSDRAQHRARRRADARSAGARRADARRVAPADFLACGDAGGAAFDRDRPRHRHGRVVVLAARRRNHLRPVRHRLFHLERVFADQLSGHRRRHARHRPARHAVDVGGAQAHPAAAVLAEKGRGDAVHQLSGGDASC